MEIFLDTANADDVKELAAFIDGVTTNPSLVAKEDRSVCDVAKEILKYKSGPLSLEVIATRYEEMMSEAMSYRKLSDNIVIKLPITKDGLNACKDLSADGIPVNMTLCFSAAQAILAAKCGATYVSPFVGRLDDIGDIGLRLIEDIRDIYYNYFDTKIIVASVRSVSHVVEAAKIGADVVTIPPKILEMMLKHPLTDVGLEKFLRDAGKL